MDSTSFIAEFVAEYISNRNLYDDLGDLLDATIDDYVSNNTVNENKTIVAEYAGDVFDAIKLYELHLGTADELYTGTKDYFYQQLAYVSLFVNLFPRINKIVKEKLETITESPEQEISIIGRDNNIKIMYNELYDSIVENYYIIPPYKSSGVFAA